MNDEHFNSLTPSEDERLACLAEECAEVIAAIGKIQRHGYASRTNRYHIAEEIGNVLYMMNMMLEAGDIVNADVIEGARSKSTNLPRYSHHQPKQLFYATDKVSAIYPLNKSMYSGGIPLGPQYKCTATMPGADDVECSLGPGHAVKHWNGSLDKSWQ